MKTPERHQWRRSYDFIVNFEQISQSSGVFFVEFEQIPAGNPVDICRVNI